MQYLFYYRGRKDEKIGKKQNWRIFGYELVFCCAKFVLDCDCTAHLLSLLFNVYVQLAWEPSAAKITENYSCHVTYGQSYSDPIPS